MKAATAVIEREDVMLLKYWYKIDVNWLIFGLKPKSVKKIQKGMR